MDSLFKILFFDKEDILKLTNYIFIIPGCGIINPEILALIYIKYGMKNRHILIELMEITLQLNIIS
jgi:hypothetical protein